MLLKQINPHYAVFVLYAAIAAGMFFLSGLSQGDPEQERIRQFLLRSGMRSNSAEMAEHNLSVRYQMQKLADAYPASENTDYARRAEQINTLADQAEKLVQFQLSVPYQGSVAFHLSLVSDSLKNLAGSLAGLVREDSAAVGQIHAQLDISELSAAFQSVPPQDTTRWGLLSEDLIWRIRTAEFFAEKALETFSKKLQPLQEIARTPILELENGSYPLVGQPFAARLRLVSQYKNNNLILPRKKGQAKDGVYYWTERASKPGLLKIETRSILKGPFRDVREFSANFTIPVFEP